MGLLDLFSPWRRTAAWLDYEREALQLVAAHVEDQGFVSILCQQIDAVFEVRRSRLDNGYQSWPAFYGRASFFATCKIERLARIEANVNGGKAVVEIGVGGGMIGKLIVSGPSLPKPHRIVLDNPVVVELRVPIAPSLPEPSAWVAGLIRRGLLERGDKPLSIDERLRCTQNLPNLPADLSSASNRKVVWRCLEPINSQFSAFGNSPFQSCLMDACLSRS